MYTDVDIYIKKKTELLCMLSLVNGCVYMRVFKHSGDMLDSYVFLRNILKSNINSTFSVFIQSRLNILGDERILESYTNPRQSRGFS